MKAIIALLLLFTSTLASNAFNPEEVKRSWLYGSDKERKMYDSTLKKNIPKFSLGKPINADQITSETIKGKYTIIDVWATWCGPCIASIPHNNEIYEKYKNSINFIGVCAEKGADQLPSVVKKKKIKYPVGIDVGNLLTNATKISGYPTYHLIGPNGKLIVADINSDSLDEVIELILKDRSNDQTN